MRPWLGVFALVATVACASNDDDGAGGAASVGAGGPSTSSSGAAGSSTSTGAGGTSATVALPEGNVPFDYQLGGAYPPPTGVALVVRDRTEASAPGLYNVCYVNGFQAQPDATAWWLDNHPDLVLRDPQGQPIVDPDWDEVLLDPRQGAALLAVIGPQIEQCASDGFDAVEIDNLDSYERSQGQLVPADNVAFMASLSATAHGVGLAIAQKNAAALLPEREAMGTDFAVSEECNRYGECQDFVAAYGARVFVVEYRQEDFDAGCAAFPQLSIVLRDLDLVTPTDGAYVYDGC